MRRAGFGGFDRGSWGKCRLSACCYLVVLEEGWDAAGSFPPTLGRICRGRRGVAPLAGRGRDGGSDSVLRHSQWRWANACIWMSLPVMLEYKLRFDGGVEGESMSISMRVEKLKKPTLRQTLLGRKPKVNAFIKAKNLALSDQFSAAGVAEIEGRYRVDLATEYGDQWRNLLEELLFRAARDGEFDDVERAFIREYVNAFKIPRETSEAILRKAGKRAFVQIAADFIEDGRLDDKEKTKLELIAARFGLENGDATGAYTTVVRERVDEFLDEVLEADLISDDDYAALQRLLGKLRANATNREEIEFSIQGARAKWRALHGEIEGTTETEIKLHSEEHIYFRGRADWHETRKERAGGRSFNQLKHLASGDLILTNQRLLFLDEDVGCKTVRWSSVLKINICGPTVFEVVKERGKSPRIHVVDASFGEETVAGYLAMRFLEEV